MPRKRDECCWCGEKLQPRIRFYIGSYRGRPKRTTNKTYPNLCPKCTNNERIKSKFKEYDVIV